jgi:hypothetical protein
MQKPSQSSAKKTKKETRKEKLASQKKAKQTGPTNHQLQTIKSRKNRQSNQLQMKTQSIYA